MQITAHYHHRRIKAQHGPEETSIIIFFSKAFDIVEHNKLISKLQNHGIQEKTLNG